ncbi:hypothetical protein FA95DRAFT_1426035 [Auriscalpium vulgare]|uniref:Uncharacterized protein n=1 Tax=Auriscalpium vulgare TaxID=40419 RepID=A0ACB8R0E3_9AGAM|nr:hypothetical protein FA95DRAFT_1426035 [Auriscalpium vulgare]
MDVRSRFSPSTTRGFVPLAPRSAKMSSTPHRPPASPESHPASRPLSSEPLRVHMHLCDVHPPAERALGRRRHPTGCLARRRGGGQPSRGHRRQRAEREKDCAGAGAAHARGGIGQLYSWVAVSRTLVEAACVLGDRARAVRWVMTAVTGADSGWEVVAAALERTEMWLLGQRGERLGGAKTVWNGPQFCPTRSAV